MVRSTTTLAFPALIATNCEKKKQMSCASSLQISILHYTKTSCRLPDPSLLLTYSCQISQADWLGEDVYTPVLPVQEGFATCYLTDKPAAALP